MRHPETENTTLDPRLNAALGQMQQEQVEHPDWLGFQQQIMDKMADSRPSFMARLAEPPERVDRTASAAVGMATSAALALVAGLMFLTGQPGVSYASVMSQLRELHNMVLTSRVELGHENHTETVIHYQRPDLIRTETTTWIRDEPITSTLTVTDLTQQQSVVLIDGAKMAMVIELPEQDLSNPDVNPLFWLEDLQAVSDASAVDLGTLEINGFDTQGFQVQTELLDIVIWADQDTAVPVRFEITPLTGSPLPEEFKILGDAEINIDLDPALFLMDIPSDYQLMPIDVRN